MIGERGATFPTSVTNWPVCCPSRATFQTGQYAHNHEVLGNSPPLGGFDRLDISQTLPVWLQGAGYYTAHIGKFLNGYERSTVGVPPGWSEWHGSKDTYRFYGYTLLEDGALNTYGSPSENPDSPANPASYSTDVYTDKAVELIDRRRAVERPVLPLGRLSRAALRRPERSRRGARVPVRAAPRSRRSGTPATFASEPLPIPPNFNEADVTDKPASIANREPLDRAGHQPRDTQLPLPRRSRCSRSTRASARIVSALRESGELNDTLFIYTADNGFFHGEHRIPSGKNRVYEEAIRVPLLMRGPGVPKGVEVEDMAINADLSPTILDAAERQGHAAPGRALAAEASPRSPIDGSAASS